MRIRIILVTALVAILTFGVLSREPEPRDPGTVGLDGDTTTGSARPAPSRSLDPTDGAGASSSIDAARLVTTLSVLADDSMRGRAAGTEGGARARRFLLAELADAGVRPWGASLEHPFDIGARGTGTNLLGVVPGSSAGPWIVLSAHYDHEGIRGDVIYNGADDNASGVAVVLEIARVLREEPLRHPVLVALFDDEEQGLNGARTFVAEAGFPLDSVALNVNLDMVARADDGILWAAGAHHTPALRPVLERAAEGAPLELRLGHDRPGAPEGADWTTQSDHGAFHEVGIPFVYFGVDDHPDYHRPTDDVERVDPETFFRSAQTILQSVRELDRALPLPDPPGVP